MCAECYGDPFGKVCDMFNFSLGHVVVSLSVLAVMDKVYSTPCGEPVADNHSCDVFSGGLTGHTSADDLYGDILEVIGVVVVDVDRHGSPLLLGC